MNAQERAAMQQALDAICGAKLCEFNSMSSRREQQRLMDEAIAILRAALAQEQPEPQDDELSAALGWPGGISDPVLDRKTLLQQVAAQEPVSWGVDWGSKGDQSCVSILKKHPNGVVEVVAVEYGPPQRPPLTDEEIWQVYYDLPESDFEGSDRIAFARAIERKVRGE